MYLKNVINNVYLLIIPIGTFLTSQNLGAHALHGLEFTAPELIVMSHDMKYLKGFLKTDRLQVILFCFSMVQYFVQSVVQHFSIIVQYTVR